VSVFAGCFQRRPGSVVPSDAIGELRALVSRSAADSVVEFSGTRLYIAMLDIGAYGESAYCSDANGSVSLIAGEPLLDFGAARVITRDRDIARLHQSWSSGDWPVLRTARGVFCGVHFDAMEGTLSLITDKLGVRNLYYYVSPEHVVFATALRILEDFSGVPKRMDVRGVTELTCFGYPLADRTPYYDVRVLRSGEVLHFSAGSTRRSHYWRWDEFEPDPSPESRQLEHVHERFTDAVRIRLRDDAATLSFLSGGLDSRCVVAALRATGAAVHTFNWARAGSQDQVFAAEFARRAGTLHTEKPLLELEHVDLMRAIAQSWDAMCGRLPPVPERPRIVWSGDGGSVGLGHVYLSRRVAGLAQQGRTDAAVAGFISEQHADVRAMTLRRSLARTIAGLPAQGIREELDDIRCEDRARALHLFLMLNDQRRHLSYFFENIDLLRFELHFPFYDSSFLESVIRIPVERCLGHGFYTKWLSMFPVEVRTVAWQAYPGHVPCPVPVPHGLEYQWATATPRRERGQSNPVRALIGAEDFAAPILSRTRLRFALLLHERGLRQLDHLFNAALSYHHYWRISKGEYVAP
jgi:asparagine synthase (glutamine-hydrolysing)